MVRDVAQAAGLGCEVTAEEVEEGETDKLMRRILLIAHEVREPSLHNSADGCEIALQKTR